jgi:D-3-phosphoglycerate dehydrogenase / 2-oxoglutarate reductase
MTLRVLISAPYFQAALPRFRPLFDARGIELVVPDVTECLAEASLFSLVSDVDGAICGDDAFTERVLRAAPRLKVICKWGTGVDSIDRSACSEMGVAVCNTPDAFTDPVADSALGYVLAFARNIPWMDAAMKGGRWAKVPGVALAECTLGIVGVGCIGKAVARRARAFGMTLLGCDPQPPDAAFLQATALHMVSLDELLARADFVTLHCDLNPTSRHLMDDAAFARMKPGAVLINTARGPIVDERALVRALERRAIAGAALDVYEAEPLPEASPLYGMSQVLLAPHNANSSPRAWERVHLGTLNALFTALGVPGL